MQLRPFALEEYFARYEFNVKYLLSASDCEALSLRSLLDLTCGDTRRLWDELKLSYTETPGHPLLRAEIAGLYERIAPDDVLVTVPEEAIFIAMNVLLQPGDHAVVLSPAYQSLYEVAQGIGCAVTKLRLEPAGDRWALDLDALRAAVSARTKLLVVNFPHNPTGFLPTRAEFETILGLAAERRLHVLSDEMYRHLEHPPAETLPAACDLYERAVSLCGLSKTFALPGLRLGWLATRDRDLLARCTAFKAYTTICHSAPSEILGVSALQAKETLIERSRAIVRANIAVASAFFARHPSRFAWIPPQAGSVALPRLLADTPIEDFCQALLNRKNTMLLPGSVFELEGDWFRLGLGRTNFPAALAQLADFIEEAGYGNRGR